MPIFKKKNEDFFKKWSPEMAYILGFFTADGSMIKNKRGAHFIEFQITDRDLLIKIREALGSNHKITARKRNKRWKTSYRLQVGSKEIFRDLIKLGITPNKSKSIGLPQVKPHYFSHFARGYFDGDGNVPISKYVSAETTAKKYTTILSGFVSGSKKFLKKLHIELKKLSNINGGILYFHDKGYRLSFSVKDSLALYHFLYKDTKNDLFLLRKRKKFEKYFKIR